MLIWDPLYYILALPALLLGLWAEMRIKIAYSQAQQRPAPLSGAAAARHILDSAGIQNVEIEAIPGNLTDHYDSRAKVLRLSEEVYQSRTLAAVGIAAHESGHAIQDARAYAPLTMRNAIVSTANIGSSLGMLLFFLGMMLHMNQLLMHIGIVLFGCVVVFQLINLPVEFNASNRAKAQLVQLGIINEEELVYVKKVLSAAALTYVAATLQAIMTLVYLIMRSQGRRN